MANYAIGDIQGCYSALQNLLDEIQFQPQQDQLWLTGDLVNRGSQSLEVLRFVKGLDKPAHVVLGNHDFHLLSVANGVAALGPHDTFQDVLQAPDCAELCLWLRNLPLIYHDVELDFTLVHAGIWPYWTLAQAQCYAAEVEAILRSEQYMLLLAHLYGNTPTLWEENLFGHGRWRFIVNSFTRMRYCDQQGNLNLTTKTEPGTQPLGYLPWFLLPERLNKEQKILFGHWASLKAKTDTPNVYALDTGCVWGRCLTALRLEDGQRFSVNCGQQ